MHLQRPKVQKTNPPDWPNLTIFWPHFHVPKLGHTTNPSGHLANCTKWALKT